MSYQQHYHLYKGFVAPGLIEQIVAETLAVHDTAYTHENLEQHSAYLADVQPNRFSSAFAFSDSYQGLLPTLDMKHFPSELMTVAREVLYTRLRLNPSNRVLFNIQKYFGGAERVPKHCDGELLHFDVEKDGNLKIHESIRPRQVAVLTLVNDSNHGGTRLHFPDGHEVVVRGEAGDLLVFDNHEVYHSVDELRGEPRRADGLLRMIIGWRSLGQETSHMKDGKLQKLDHQYAAEDIISDWHRDHWPAKWAAAKGTSGAF